MELLLLVIGLVVVDILALRFGEDSRVLHPQKREPFVV